MASVNYKKTRPVSTSTSSLSNVSPPPGLNISVSSDRTVSSTDPNSTIADPPPGFNNTSSAEMTRPPLIVIHQANMSELAQHLCLDGSQPDDNELNLELSRLMYVEFAAHNDMPDHLLEAFNSCSTRTQLPSRKVAELIDRLGYFPFHRSGNTYAIDARISCELLGYVADTVGRMLSTLEDVEYQRFPGMLSTSTSRANWRRTILNTLSDPRFRCTKWKVIRELLLELAANPNIPIGPEDITSDMMDTSPAAATERPTTIPQYFWESMNSKKRSLIEPPQTSSVRRETSVTHEETKDTTTTHVPNQYFDVDLDDESTIRDSTTAPPSAFFPYYDSKKQWLDIMHFDPIVLQTIYPQVACSVDSSQFTRARRDGLKNYIDDPKIRKEVHRLFGIYIINHGDITPWTAPAARALARKITNLTIKPMFSKSFRGTGQLTASTIHLTCSATPQFCEHITSSLNENKSPEEAVYSAIHLLPIFTLQFSAVCLLDTPQWKRSGSHSPSTRCSSR